MSYFDRIWNGLKAVLQIEGDVARLTARVEQLDARERETRERLVYLEGYRWCESTGRRWLGKIGAA